MTVYYQISLADSADSLIPFEQTVQNHWNDCGYHWIFSRSIRYHYRNFCLASTAPTDCAVPIRMPMSMTSDREWAPCKYVHYLHCYHLSVLKKIICELYVKMHVIIDKVQTMRNDRFYRNHCVHSLLDDNRRQWVHL